MFFHLICIFVFVFKKLNHIRVLGFLEKYCIRVSVSFRYWYAYLYPCCIERDCCSSSLGGWHVNPSRHHHWLDKNKAGWRWVADMYHKHQQALVQACRVQRIRFPLTHPCLSRVLPQDTLIPISRRHTTFHTQGLAPNTCSCAWHVR